MILSLWCIVVTAVGRIVITCSTYKLKYYLKLFSYPYTVGSVCIVDGGQIILYNIGTTLESPTQTRSVAAVALERAIHQSNS